MPEMLATPAPFVFGGNFSDYVKEGRKFRRFSTLASLARAACNDKDDTPTRDDDIKTLYAAAREEDVGTVSRVDLPEVSISIVNLVDVARFIRQSMQLDGCSTSQGETEEETANDYDEWNAEEGEELEDLDVECAPTKPVLEIPRPVVYEGTFQDYKKGVAKFTRFKTLSRLSHQRICADVDVPQESMAEELKAAPLVPAASLPSMEMDDGCIDTGDCQQCSIIECPLLPGSTPCQLLALAIPPSMEAQGSVFTTLSNAIVTKLIASTMAGAKAAVKMAAAFDLPQQNRMPLMPDSKSDVLQESTSDTAKIDSVVKDVPSKSANRFQFAKEHLQILDSAVTKGVSFSAMPAMQKKGIMGAFHDDGSSWTVDNAVAVGSTWRRRTSRLSGSGSSWGGGGTVLEPICQGKFACDQPIKVVLCNVPGA